MTGAPRNDRGTVPFVIESNLRRGIDADKGGMEPIKKPAEEAGWECPEQESNLQGVLPPPRPQRGASANSAIRAGWFRTAQYNRARGVVESITYPSIGFTSRATASAWRLAGWRGRGRAGNVFGP